MIEANMLEAKTKLSKLVQAAERGEQVFLKRNGVRVARIVPLPKKKFPLGFLKGKGADTPDSLLFGMPEEEFSDFTKL
jgi:prevent-host-death family protein